MVHQSFSPCVCAKNLPSNQEDSVSCSKWGYSPSESETAYSVMQGVSGQLIDCNIPGGFADVLMIMSFWKQTTRRQYDVHFCEGCTFGLQKKTDSLHPSVRDVFLHTFHGHQLSYATINIARSALSSYLMGSEFPGCHYTVTNHPFVVRCLKVVFNCRKLIPCARYQETWMSNLSWSIWNCYIFWKSSLSRSLPSNWLPC